MKVLGLVSACLLLFGSLPSSAINTTITPPTTTPSAPTTQEPTTPTTTPTTTPAPPPPTTTTTAPITTPKPPTPEWNINSTDGKICILLALDASFNITYNTTEHTKETITVPVPATSDKDGSCEEAWISLTFRYGAVGAQFVLNTTFSQDKSTYQVSSMTLQYKYDINTFPKAQDADKQVTAAVTDIPSYLKGINTKNSVKCAVDKELDMAGVDAEAKFLIADIQVQAYMTADSASFGEPKDCVAKKTSDVVPIAVGCALAALVVIVLIAYLIGRRRSRQQGYQSV